MVKLASTITYTSLVMMGTPVFIAKQKNDHYVKQVQICIPEKGYQQSLWGGNHARVAACCEAAWRACSASFLLDAQS